jgi:hypothetical protein
MRAALIVHTAVALSLIAALSAQAPAPGPSRFDVVSIKRNTSGSNSSSSGTVPGAAWSMNNASTLALIYSAYP